MTENATPAAGKAIALTCVQAHPRAHTYGVEGKRFRVLPKQQLVVPVDVFAAHIEPDAVFRREYHNGEIAVQIVDAVLLAQPPVEIEVGPDPAPPPVLGGSIDAGIFLSDPNRPISEAELASKDPAAASLAAARGVDLAQFLADRDARAAAAPPLPPPPAGGSKGKGKSSPTE